MKIVLFLSLFVVSVAAGAAEIEDVTFGFNGHYKTGTWVPLRITVRSQDQLTAFIGELVVEVRSYASETPIERYASGLQLSPIAARKKNFYIYCPKKRDTTHCSTRAYNIFAEDNAARDTGDSLTNASFTQRLPRARVGTER